MARGSLANVSPEPNPLGASNQADDSADLYELAYTQGLRALDDQLDELSGARSRASQFMALTITATAFLVGSGLNSSTNRDWIFYTLAIAGTVASVAALVAMITLMQPRNFHFRMKPKTLVERWIERDVPAPPSKADLLRGLSLRIQDMIDSNETLLGTIRSRYWAVVVIGSASLLLWVTLVWARA